MSRPTTIDPFSITGWLLDSQVREVVGGLWWKRVKEKKGGLLKDEGRCQREGEERVRGEWPVVGNREGEER